MVDSGVQEEKFHRAGFKIGFRKCCENREVKGLEGLMLGFVLEAQGESRSGEEEKRRQEDMENPG